MTVKIKDVADMQEFQQQLFQEYLIIIPMFPSRPGKKYLKLLRD